ncbi:anti-sigma factor [Comamonas endophytica]|uniref:Regulator of SigK n=1 Tax=Comamonas endophytica TaxID=2949090 RepID=A0ABY6GFP8_9BURK|nr:MULTISPECIES: anti-sigma factor [unclassified Acidovorax]MCD2514388.1 anti-sigma factor [Acidovorax sp. D4N7]UYG53678.1 anti-sigma factor [Acidovorax sp. 5MLIR]
MNQNNSENFPLDGDAQLQALAGEYVLGTLTQEERREVEARLPGNPALREAVAAWEQRFVPLLSLVEPVAPPEYLWQRIARSLELQRAPAAPARARPLPWWRDLESLRLWRGLAAGGFALASLLAALLVVQAAAPQPGTRYMVVLVAPGDRAPGWVMQTSSAKRIELIPLVAAEIPEDKALELWTKADSWNTPVSLGLVEPGQSVQIPLDRIPGVQPNQLFELTLEPRTGSPTGRPTGPIHFIGRSVKVS